MNKTKEALEKVLQYQLEVQAAIRSIADLEAAIENHQAIITNANSYETKLPDLHIRREDLLAEMVIEGASRDELDKLDKEIEAEKERLNKFASHAAETVPDAKQAIAGLRRKMQASIDAFEELKNKKPEVLAVFIQAEAEQIGTEYMRNAVALAENYRRLLAYDSLMRLTNRTGPQASREMVIPVFCRLDSHQGFDKQPNIGEVWEVLKTRNYPDVRRDTINEEKERIRALGVDF